MARASTFFSLCLALASTAQATTLLEAVNAARDFDVGIAAARNAQSAGREKRWQGLAGLLPRAQIDGNYAKQGRPDATYASTVRRHAYSASITQPIFDLSRIADSKRGNALAAQADAEFFKAQQELITQVSNAYFDVLYLREVVLAAQAALSAFAKQLAQAKAALKLGDGTHTEVDEAGANFDQALATTVAAENDLEVADGTYARLTGLSASDISPSVKRCTFAAPPFDLAAVIDEAAHSNLDVRIAELQLEQSRADIAATVGSNLPTVSIQGTYGANWSRGSNQNLLDQWFGTTSKTRSSMIGVTVTIPLFAGGGQLSVAREAFLRRDQARDTLEDARRKARESARAAYLGITNGNALVKARGRALVSADSKVKSTRLGREVGLRTSLDELNALQQYFAAIRDLANARYTHLRARLQLSTALGTLSDADLIGLPCY
jgi:outer membrane protein